MSAPSRVHVDSVRAIAATIGAPPVDADAARALASDCEYRLRQVFQLSLIHISEPTRPY